MPDPEGSTLGHEARHGDTLKDRVHRSAIEAGQAVLRSDPQEPLACLSHREHDNRRKSVVRGPRLEGRIVERGAAPERDGFLGF